MGFFKRNQQSSPPLPAPESEVAVDPLVAEAQQRHREAAAAILPKLEASIAQLHEAIAHSRAWIESQGQYYMGRVDLGREGPGLPISGWFVRPVNMPRKVELLPSEIPSDELPIKDVSASLVIPFNGEPKLIGSEAASFEFLAAGWPGEISSHVPLAVYAASARWVIEIEDRSSYLAIESADRTFDGLNAAILDHLTEIVH